MKPTITIVLQPGASPLEELESISPIEEPSEEIKPAIRPATRAHEYVEKFGCGCEEED